MRPETRADCLLFSTARPFPSAQSPVSATSPRPRRPFPQAACQLSAGPLALSPSRSEGDDAARSARSRSSAPAAVSPKTPRTLLILLPRPRTRRHDYIPAKTPVNMTAPKVVLSMWQVETAEAAGLADFLSGGKGKRREPADGSVTGQRPLTDLSSHPFHHGCLAQGLHWSKQRTVRRSAIPTQQPGGCWA